MRTKTFIGATISVLLMSACVSDKAAEAPAKSELEMTEGKEKYDWIVEDFADIRILKYQIPGWDQLTLQQQQVLWSAIKKLII